jgi:arginine:ornithine antiporter/lysine permease
MLVTVFVFIGVEGASVYSRYARKREDVGTATILGFLSVLALFALVTILSYGVVPRADLSELRQPSMAGVLQAVVGGWGAAFVSAGLIISVLGAYLAWALMAAEVAFVAAQNQDMPKFLARSNDKGVPHTALLATSSLTQLFLLTTLYSDDAFAFTLELTSALSLVPYLLAAAFAVQVARAQRGAGEGKGKRRTELWIAGIATFYTAFLLYAAGLKFLLLSCLLYAPGSILFFKSRREQGRQVFTPAERGLFVVTAIGAVVAIVALSAGWIGI